jgi:hypothetical protein
MGFDSGYESAEGQLRRSENTQSLKRETMRRTLVVNPAADRVFSEFARMIVDHGAVSTYELERRLRGVYPNAVVHARELVDEPILVWYVYRDGHWVDTRTIVAQPGAQEGDARPTRGSSSDRGIDSRRPERVKGLEDKPTAERELSEDIQASK